MRSVIRMVLHPILPAEDVDWGLSLHSEHAAIVDCPSILLSLQEGYWALDEWSVPWLLPHKERP